MAKTYNDVYMSAVKRLKQTGADRPDFEARLLLSFAADKTVSEFYRDIRLYCGTEYEKEAENIIERRVNGEPCAYITGFWEFYGLPFYISRDVLIPRIDSEIVAETAIKLLKVRKESRLLDLCCGSGCIGIAAAKNAPGTRLVCADISAEALRITKNNTRLNKISYKASCLKINVFETPPMILGSFDMLVCNPPYIKTGDIEMLDQQVKNYEPLSALDGGEDGLSFFRAVCEKWLGVLNDGAFLVFECGQGQSPDVVKIAKQAGLRHIESVKDTLGIERAIVLQIV